MQIEITSELLADLKEKAEKATQGNWFVTYHPVTQLVVNCVAQDIYETRIASFDDTHYGEANAEYIAAVNPAVILALIERIEKLEGFAMIAQISASRN